MSHDEFEHVLAQYLAAMESDCLERQQQLLQEYPQFAEEIHSFVRFSRKMLSAIGRADSENPAVAVSHDSSVRTIPDTFLAQPPSANFGSGSAWSLGQLEGADFPMQFGPYVLLSEIDRGGMGIVFKARHQSLNRTVALKVMRAGEGASAQDIRRFRVEVEASAALNHANIIPIYEVGQEHGLLYFTMAYIDGEDLADTLRRRTLTPREIARITLKIADAVSAAHRQGIVHRDLKPSNILLGADGEPYLADFGLAKHEAFDDELTHTGQIIGTPAYMSPEQARGNSGRRSPLVDVYSLGAVLYAMLTRQAPFQGPTPFDVMLKVLDREPPAPSRIISSTPRNLEIICLRAMAKEPTERYSSAAALAADLQRFLKDEPIQPPRPALAERLEIWWRREPILISHLCGIGAVMFIVLISYLIRQEGAPEFAFRFGLLSIWAAVSIALQQLSLIEKWRDRVHLSWALSDIVIYTTLIYFASPPRGLLLVGYPMMIAASGLFYRTSFVVFMTSLCIVGFLFLSMTVNDPIAERVDFTVIYGSGLAVLGLCLVSMIRRVRGLTRFCDENDAQSVDSALKVDEI